MTIDQHSGSNDAKPVGSVEATDRKIAMKMRT